MDPRFTFRKGYDTDLLVLRSLFALDSNTNKPISSFNTVVADGVGGVNWLTLTQYFSAGTGILNFVSSIESFSTVTGNFSNYSTLGFSTFYTEKLLASTVNTFNVSSQNTTLSSLTFRDTAQQILNFSSGNLFVNGSLFYNPNTVSTSLLVSTVVGLGTAGYVSSSQLTSTVAGLGPNGFAFVNRPELVSTTAGIFTTTQNNLVSTTIGIGLSGPLFASTVRGLGTAGYISSSQLQSTVLGLGGTGLVSTGQLTSTVVGLQDSFYVVNANNVFINNSRVSISTTGSVIFFSTFMNSSITYLGNNGQFTASNAGGASAPFYFSSAVVNLDRWSTFISATSIVTLEAYPNFLFGNNAIPGTNPALIFMSSFIQSGNTFTSSQMVQTAIYPNEYTANRSNSFNQPLKLTIPGIVVQGLYPNPMHLVHYLPNAKSVGVTQGFLNTNVSVFFASTNSLFLSIQNLPL